MTALPIRRSDNLRGAGLMVVSMGAFALEDMAIKLMSGTLSVGQILTLLGLGGALVLGGLVTSRGAPLFTPDFLRGSVLARNGSEVFGTFGFVTALALIPISLASTILMAVPLVLTVAAWLLLKERVGWRRWIAVALGFVGVLMVLRPGMGGFDPASLYALIGVVGLALRDVAARKVPASVDSLHLSLWAFMSIVPLGLCVMAVQGSAWVPMDLRLWATMTGTVAIGLFSYSTLVAATRIGEVSAIVPFRYSRIVFAMIIGVLVFGERPDPLTIAGAALIVGTGLYAFWRERMNSA